MQRQVFNFADDQRLLFVIGKQSLRHQCRAYSNVNILSDIHDTTSYIAQQDVCKCNGVMMKIFREESNHQQLLRRTIMLIMLLMMLMTLSDAESLPESAPSARVSSASSSSPEIQRMELIRKNATYSERSCENLVLSTCKNLQS